MLSQIYRPFFLLSVTLRPKNPLKSAWGRSTHPTEPIPVVIGPTKPGPDPEIARSAQRGVGHGLNWSTAAPRINRAVRRRAMIPASSHLQHATSYLNIQLTHAGHEIHPVPLGPFVTISRESGLGGNAFAEMLVPLLSSGNDHSWSVYSANLIDEMLRTNQLPPHLARFLPEDRVSEFNATIGEIVGLHPSLWMLVSKTNELIRRIARGGHAILLGRGANFATADLPGGVHVRLVAREAYRDARAAGRRGVDLAEASAWNAHRDAARRRYVKANFSANIADPAAYDYVINLERVSLEAAAGLVVDAVARLSRPAAALTTHG